MIVVATEDFGLYHEAVQALRDRGVNFTTVEPDADVPDETAVVIATRDDEVDLGNRDDVVLVVADPENVRPAVDEALAILRGGDGRTIVGVDPGPNPGIAVLADETVVAAFEVPLSDAVDAVREEVADAPDALVRVGDGDRLKGARIINELEDATVELVDETGTTPYLGPGARGMADVLAAVNIAHSEGERIESREIDPTKGELQRIKNESRERSAGDRTIDEGLARRVAGGELTVEEALAEHRDQADDEDRGEADETTDANPNEADDANPDEPNNANDGFDSDSEDGA